MRFVPVKTEDQQAALVRHKVRDVLVRQRTQWVNALRGHLAEFGVTVRKGLSRVADLVAVIEDEADHRVPTVARAALRIIIDVLAGIDRKIEDLDREVATSAKADLVAKRLMTVPGVGPIIASRIAASFPNPGVFRSGRDFAASLGLVPRQNSTGGKSLLGGISKQGSGTLRRLLVGGAGQDRWRPRSRRQSPKRAPSPARTSRAAPGPDRGDPASPPQAAGIPRACAPPLVTAKDRHRRTDCRRQNLL